MTSKISAWNLALSSIKSTGSVASETEKSQEANQCNRFHDFTLDWIYSKRDWTFATKRVILASIGTAPVDWQYQYAYPSDCVRDIEILTGLRDNADQIPYQLSLITVSGTDQKVILTDRVDAELKYVSRIKDFTLLPPYAVELYIAKLADFITLPLGGDLKLKAGAQGVVKATLASAKVNDANRGTRDPERDSEFTRIRE